VTEVIVFTQNTFKYIHTHICIESTYYRYSSAQRTSFIKLRITEGVNLIRPNDPVSVFRGSLEAGRYTARALRRDANNRRRRAGVMSWGVSAASRWLIGPECKWTTYTNLHHLDLVEAEEVCIPARRKQDRPGWTGDYFARIAPSSQKAAPLICLRYGDRGLPIITYDPRGENDLTGSDEPLWRSPRDGRNRRLEAAA